MTDMSDTDMTDAATHVHGEDADADGAQTALRARIRALGPDAIVEIARGANMPQCAGSGRSATG